MRRIRLITDNPRGPIELRRGEDRVIGIVDDAGVVQFLERGQSRKTADGPVFDLFDHTTLTLPELYQHLPSQGDVEVVPLSEIHKELAVATGVGALEDELTELCANQDRLSPGAPEHAELQAEIDATASDLLAATELMLTTLASQDSCTDEQADAARPGAEFWRIIGNSSFGESFGLATWFVIGRRKGDAWNEDLLGERWYRKKKWKRRKHTQLPRRNGMAPNPTAYSLFPRGIQQTLYGSFILYVRGYDELSIAAGPPPIGTRHKTTKEEDRAAQELDKNPFPVPLSQERPDSHTDDYLCDRVLNGMYPQGFRRADGKLWVDLNWNACRFDGRTRLGDNQRYRLPNLTAAFEVSEDRLTLTTIEVQYRKAYVEWVDEPEDLEEAVVLTPDQPGLWDRAKRVLRGGLVLDAQLDLHLARGHLLCEQVAVALWRSGLEPGDRMFDLLQRHLDGVDVINRMGDFLILGERGSLATVSALHHDAIEATIAHRLGSYDWKGFAPRTPLTSNDVYAQASQTYWDACHAYVAQELAGVTWRNEFERFSDELVEHAVPRTPYRGLPGASWTHSDELVKHTQSRALSPVTSIEELREFCCWVVFHATFFHSWINDAQWDDAGDAAFAPLSLRGTIFDHPNDTNERWWEKVRPHAIDEGYMALIHNALTRFDMGYVLVDDLAPRTTALKPFVESLGAPFGEAAADRRLHPNRIRSRLNS